MRTTSVALLAAAALVAIPAAASAQGGKKDEVLIIPLTGNVAGALKAAPGAFSASLAKLAASSGSRPMAARVAKSDITTLVGCSAESEGCYTQVAKTMGVTELIFGKVESQPGGGLKVTLTRVQPKSKRQTRTYTFMISAKTLPAAQKQFEAQASRTLEQSSIDTEPVVEPKKTVPPPTKVTPKTTAKTTPNGTHPPPETKPHTGSSFSFGRVKGSAWAVAIGGAGAMILGGVFFALASSKQSDVNDAPVSSGADLDKLADLESTGKTYNILGNSFVIVGAVATAVGGYLIYRQGSAQPATERRVGVAPIDRGRGLAVSLSGNF